MADVLLIDADIVAFRAAEAAQTPVDFGDGLFSLIGDEKEARARADQDIYRCQAAFSAREAVLCLSDTGPRWRESLSADYKSHRTKPKPLVYYALREYLVDVHGALWEQGLEGDDLLGLLATGEYEGRSIIVSVDKDMRTIPGLLATGFDGKVEVISQEQADRNHMIQTLSGDATDGYKGVPGIGPKKAAGILEDAEEEGPSVWEAVVHAYEKAGLAEADALLNARLARILRHGEFDWETKEVQLWTP